MNTVRQYLLCIVAAAILISILTTLYDNKDATGSVIKIIGGIFLTITIISPMKDFQLHSFTENLYDKEQVDAAVGNGQDVANNMYREHIKQQTEAYILRKANDLDAQIAVEVILSESEEAIPVRVTLNGPVSPYVKSTLQSYISQDLGINKENQVWN